MTQPYPIVGQIGDAASAEALWALTLRHFTSEGFGAVAYLLFDRGRINAALAFLEQGFPPALVSSFAERGYGKHAPVVRMAMTTGTPQLATQVAQTHNFSAEERDHREAMFAAGLAEVLVIPLFGPMGRNAVLFLGETGDPSLYHALDWNRLQIIAQMIHLRTLDFTQGHEGLHDLSPRELQILRWIAQGKNNAAISETLGIAVGTVDTYLRRLFEKLDVTDRTTAAVKGFGMGLIQS